ncbi:MAG: LamG-like jellyroll fold domain-containing protein [Patescibacteria group bacterium]|jgi:prepilin-type N-terminal cleavage/methylation domain-containing protein
MFLGRKNKNGEGFSLTELLVVIFIIALISSLATVSFFQIRKKNRDNKRVNDIYEIQLALESYKFFEGEYPATLTPGEELIGSSTGNVYLDKIPNNQPYYSYDCPADEYSYFYNEELENYSIYFCLEGNVENYLAGNKCAVSGSILDFDCSSFRIVREGLVLYYDLSNSNSYGGTGTTVYDLTENNNDGTLVGGVSYITDSGGTFDFNGSNGKVDIGNGFSLSNKAQVTFESWFLADSWVAGSPAFARTIYSENTSGTGIKYAICQTTTNLTLNTRTNTTGALGTLETISIPLPSAGQWYNLAIVYDAVNDKRIIYLNGISQHEETAAIDSLFNQTTGVLPRIGVTNNETTDRWFDGKIAEVRIYDSALSPEEVLQNFNATKSRFGL